MVAIPLPIFPPHPRAAHRLTSSATALAIVLLVASAWLANVNLQGVEEGDTVGDQVRAVQLAAEVLLSTLKDAETGQRGYLLTGDPAYLAPYDAALARLDADFAHLEATPLADPKRAGRIRRIRDLATVKLRELDRTVTLRQSGDAAAALAAVRTNRGRLEMDAIRVEVDALQSDAEETLLRARALTRSVWGWARVICLDAMACALLGWVALEQRQERLLIAANLARLERFTRAFRLTQGMMCGLDGRITFWSDGNERLYGYQPEEALGRISHDLLCTEFSGLRAKIEAALLRDFTLAGRSDTPPPRRRLASGREFIWHCIAGKPARQMRSSRSTSMSPG